MLTRSILVIEDEAVVALLYDCRVDLNHNVCAVTASGRQAIEFAARHRPALAMVDVRLKGDLDKLDTARAPSAQFGIPSILLSGDPGALHAARSNGVAPLAVLKKPYTPAQLELVLADAFVQR
jgi:two-component system, response regulator PdtaR